VTVPGPALRWASQQLGSPVECATALTGGVASEIHLLRTATGGEAVLRRLTLEPWRRFADGLLRREYDVQAMLRDTDVPAPAPIALDPDGSEAGDPALLMGRLPGRIDLVHADHARLARLAAVLVRMGSVDADKLDGGAFERDLAEVFAPMVNATGEFRVREIVPDMMRVSVKHRMRMPREFVLVTKQMLFFDRYAKLLAPTLNVMSDPRLVASLMQDVMKAKMQRAAEASTPRQST